MNTDKLKTNNPIDELGRIKALIDDLENQAKPLKATIIAMGTGQHDGDLFQATVSEVAESESYDAKDMEKKLRELGVNNNWFKHHIKVKAGYSRVLVKSR